MSEWLSKFTQPWSTTELPTQTTLTHVAPQNFQGLVSTLMLISDAWPTETNRMSLYEMARDAKGAQASLSVLSAQNFMATATDNQRLPEMTSVIWNATMELQELEKGINLYQMELSPVANGLFAGLFALLLVLHIVFCIWKRHPYFGICLSLGTACEFTGYVGRLFSIGNYGNKDAYLCQIICLTLAPALLMAGVYFVLAQLTVIHGRKFSMLKPLWFSYIFVFCDAVSLVVQAAGGASAAIQLQQFGDTVPGTNTMVAGIAFQVVSMTLFLFFLFDFMKRIWFRASPDVKFSFYNLFSFLFATGRGKKLQEAYLHQHYNQNYAHIWSRGSFAYFPLVLLLSVIFIYIRCIYRLVELTEGWSGYLITHEEFVMTLDGLMVLLMVILLVPFHPGVLMGRSLNISMKTIRQQGDENTEEVNDGKLFGDSSWSDDSTTKISSTEKCHSRDASVLSQDSDSFVPEGKRSFMPLLKRNENTEAFAAVPYSQTTEAASVNPPAEHFTSKKTKLRKPPQTQSHHINPYETPRESQYVQTLGPYSEEPDYRTQAFSYGEHLNDYDDYHYDDGSNHYDARNSDYSDVQSQLTQVTHDEEHFTFG